MVSRKRTRKNNANQKNNNPVRKNNIRHNKHRLTSKTRKLNKKYNSKSKKLKRTNNNKNRTRKVKKQVGGNVPEHIKTDIEQIYNEIPDNISNNIKGNMDELKNYFNQNGLRYLGLANKTDSKKPSGGTVTTRQFFLYTGENRTINPGTDKFYLVYLAEDFKKLGTFKNKIGMKQFTHFTENTQKPFTYDVYNGKELVFNLQGYGTKAILESLFQYMFSQNIFGNKNMEITFIDPIKNTREQFSFDKSVEEGQVKGESEAKQAKFEEVNSNKILKATKTTISLNNLYRDVKNLKDYITDIGIRDLISKYNKLVDYKVYVKNRESRQVPNDLFYKFKRKITYSIENKGGKFMSEHNPTLNTITGITINEKDVESNNLDSFLDTGFFMLILQNIMLNNKVEESLNITIEHKSRISNT